MNIVGSDHWLSSLILRNYSDYLDYTYHGKEKSKGRQEKRKMGNGRGHPLRSTCLWNLLWHPRSNSRDEGAFGSGIKMPVCHMRVPGSKSQLLFSISSLPKYMPGSRWGSSGLLQVKVQVGDSEWAPGFTWPSISHCGYLAGAGDWTMQMGTFHSLFIKETQ